MSTKKHDRNRLEDLEKTVATLETAVKRLFVELSTTFQSLDEVLGDQDGRLKELEQLAGLGPELPEGEQPSGEDLGVQEEVPEGED